MAHGARSEPVRRCAIRSRARTFHGRTGLRRSHPRHLDTGSDAAARGDDRLRGGESGPVELQQGAVQGSESQGGARRVTRRAAESGAPEVLGGIVSAVAVRPRAMAATDSLWLAPAGIPSPKPSRPV